MRTYISRKESLNLIRDYLSRLDSPRALTCWLLLEAGGREELVQLVTLSCDPDQYASVKDFRAAYAATKFLSKCASLETGIDTRQIAIEGAVKAEDRCLETNQRWSLLLSGSVRTEWEPEIHRAIAIVAKILGEAPSSEDLIGDDKGGWSKGRTTSASGPTLSPYKKYRSRLDVSVSALRYAIRELRDSPSWGAAALEAEAPVSVLKEAFTIVKGNVMLTVPKNAKTDRVICFEPHINIWLQLKVGQVIRGRLMSHGINLNRQSINQRRALYASKRGHLATIDLRSASDTVAFELVKQLLPIDWLCLLDDLRSKYTLWPDGVWKKNQKFSSMGNGFTFELESLLFYAICSAVSSNVSVYGDDIILPTENFERASAFLVFCGFEVNASKSFSHGYFRESCGMDAFAGVSCTPVYLRSFPKKTEDVVKLHNQVLEFVTRESEFPAWEPFGPMLRKWRRRFPSLHGPKGYGDGHYHANLDETAPEKARHWVEGWWFFTYTPVYKKGVDSIDGCTVGSLPAAICTSIGPKGVRNLWSSTLDRRRYLYKRVRVLASFWQDTLWT